MSIIELLERFTGPPRIISDRNTGSPYLSRWYLLGQRLGNRYANPGSRLPFNIFLHHFHRSDDAGELHSHPWQWSVSLILKGGYSEERRQPDDRVTRREYIRGDINRISGNTYHRVDLLDDTWTLFIVGPKVSTWWFWRRETGERMDWRAFCGLEPGTWELV